MQQPNQPRLRLAEHAARPQRVFCGHCGHPPDDVDAGSRVCERCNLGLMLQAPPEIAPTPADPFLVIDGSLTVCAMSQAAEALLEVSETEAVNLHVTDFLVPAEAEAETTHNLIAMLMWAARGDIDPTQVVVRPADLYGVRYWARVGSCGPPTAALLVLAAAS